MQSARLSALHKDSSVSVELYQDRFTVAAAALMYMYQYCAIATCWNQTINVVHCDRSSSTDRVLYIRPNANAQDSFIARCYIRTHTQTTKASTAFLSEHPFLQRVRIARNASAVITTLFLLSVRQVPVFCSEELRYERYAVFNVR